MKKLKLLVAGGLVAILASCSTPTIRDWQGQVEAAKGYDVQVRVMLENNKPSAYHIVIGKLDSKKHWSGPSLCASDLGADETWETKEIYNPEGDQLKEFLNDKKLSAVAEEAAPKALNNPAYKNK